MLGLLKIAQATLVAPAGNVLDDRVLSRAEAVGERVLKRLDLAFGVMAAADLGVERVIRHFRLSPWERG